jgi:hypothetical protein
MDTEMVVKKAMTGPMEDTTRRLLEQGKILAQFDATWRNLAQLYSPLRGCSGLAALAAAEIHRRRTPRSFRTGAMGGYMRIFELRILIFDLGPSRILGAVHRSEKTTQFWSDLVGFTQIRN